MQADRRRLKRLLVAFALFGIVGVVLLAIAPLISVVLLLIAEAIFLVLYLRVPGRARREA